MWYVGEKSTLDWRRLGRRDIGDYLNDHMQGKLAELAFARMLEKWGKTAEIDLEIRPGAQVINESDVRWITVNGQKRKPNIKIDVKATTPRSKYFLVDLREFENRRYDAYVLMLINLPRDHLIRFFAAHLDLPNDLRERIKPLESLEAEAVGFVYREDIERNGQLFRAGEWLPDPEKPKRRLVKLKVDNYGIPITRLRHTESEWNQFLISV
jgi:hypothetical protein